MELRKKCKKCGKEIDVEDVYCRWCGTKQISDENSIMVILAVVLLFFLIGPFCLIKLWKAETLSIRAKKIVTAVVVVATMVTMWYLNKKIDQILRQYIETINMINS